jgi:hypothetical protein
VVSSGGTTPAISLAAGYGDTLNPYASKTANFVLIAPNGSAGVPTFRAFVSADLSETLTVAKGGTGLSTYTANGVLWASSTGALTNNSSLTFNNSGNLGIGVAFASYRLQVEDFANPTLTYLASFRNTTTSSGGLCLVRWSQGQSGTAEGFIGTGGSATGGSVLPNNFAIGTTGANSLVLATNNVARINVDTSGNAQMPTGAVMPYTPAPSSISTTATLSNSDIQAQIINTTGTSYTVTMPLGTTLEAITTWVASDIGYDFTVINTASGTITIAANTGVTTLGALTITTGESAQFRIRRTAASTFVLYRLS